MAGVDIESEIMIPEPRSTPIRCRSRDLDARGIEVEVQVDGSSVIQGFRVSGCTTTYLQLEGKSSIFELEVTLNGEYRFAKGDTFSRIHESRRRHVEGDNAEGAQGPPVTPLNYQVLLCRSHGKGSVSFAEIEVLRFHHGPITESRLDYYNLSQEDFDRHTREEPEIVFQLVKQRMKQILGFADTDVPDFILMSRGKSTSAK